MTEEEWLREVEQYVPQKMLLAIERQFEAWNSESNRMRKLQLFGCATCRRIWNLYTEAARNLIELMELYADGDISREDLLAGHDAMVAVPERAPAPGEERTSIYGAFEYAESALICLVDPQFVPFVSSFVDSVYGATVNDPDNPEVEDVHLKNLLLDIFGNPFRPVSFVPEWRTSTVVSLAKSMYASRNFSVMPILGDALQDAGCEHADILDHCRGTGPHVRGCWVVDLVLGKA